MKPFKAFYLMVLLSGTLIGHQLACTHAKPDQAKTQTNDNLTMQEKNLVQDVIRTNINQINHCYEVLLSQNPKVQGKVVTEFTVKAGQPPSNIRILSSDLDNQKLHKCIVSKIRGWKFSEYKSQRPLKVRYPFSSNFRSL